MYTINPMIRPILFALVSFSISACSAYHNINGKITISYTTKTDEDVINWVGKSCSVVNEDQKTIGFAEQGIDKASKVILKDSTGKIIGLTELLDGTLVNGEPIITAPGLSVVNCEFPFEFKKIADSDFYQLEISNKAMNLSKDELIKQDWKIDLKIGS